MDNINYYIKKIKEKDKVCNEIADKIIEKQKDLISANIKLNRGNKKHGNKKNRIYII